MAVVRNQLAVCWSGVSVLGLPLWLEGLDDTLEGFIGTIGLGSDKFLTAVCTQHPGALCGFAVWGPGERRAARGPGERRVVRCQVVVGCPARSGMYPRSTT